MGATIAFIGLGTMGKPMARHLLDAGYDLKVHSRSPGPVQELVDAGAAAFDSPEQVGDAEFVITMVPDTPDVEEIAEALIPGLSQASIWIDMSTISPTVTRRLAQEVSANNAEMIDAPVSGGDKGANEATLSIMAGGTPVAFQRCMPIFQTLGKTIVHVGPSGAGQVVKACNQIMVGCEMQAMAEALVLGAKAGIEPATIVTVLSGGLARCGPLEVRGLRAAEGDFEPGFRARLHRKDLKIALDAGYDLGVPLPATALVLGLYSAMVSSGRGDLDHSGLVELLQSFAGVGGDEAGG